MTTKRAAALAIVAVTTTALTGCAGVVGAKMTFNDTEQAKITEIRLTGASGNVTVRTAAVTETTIQRVVRRDTDPGDSYRLEGGTLVVDTSCGHDCSVSYDITAPTGVGVTGELRSGDVHLSGIASTDLRLTSGDVIVEDAAGPVKVRGTSGDMRVLRASGPVDLQSTSGNIEAMSVGGPAILKVTSGDVNAELTSANSVDAQTTSGDVRVQVPAGKYRIVTHTGSGDAHVSGVTDDPAAKNVLNVRTGSGDADVVATP